MSTMKRQPRTTPGCTSWRKNFASFASLLFSLAAISPGLAHDYLEIRIKLSSTWAASTRTNEHEATAVCVLGTNDWYISGQFLRNAHLEYWLIGTNVVERKEINSNMYLKRAEDYVLEKLGPPSARRAKSRGKYRGY